MVARRGGQQKSMTNLLEDILRNGHEAMCSITDGEEPWSMVHSRHRWVIIPRRSVS